MTLKDHVLFVLKYQLNNENFRIKYKEQHVETSMEF